MCFSWPAGSSFTPTTNVLAKKPHSSGFLFSSGARSKGALPGSRGGLRLALYEMALSCGEILIPASDPHHVLRNKKISTSDENSLYCPRMAKPEQQEFRFPKHSLLT